MPEKRFAPEDAAQFKIPERKPRLITDDLRSAEELHAGLQRSHSEQFYQGKLGTPQYQHNYSTDATIDIDL